MEYPAAEDKEDEVDEDHYCGCIIVDLELMEWVFRLALMVFEI